MFPNAAKKRLTFTATSVQLSTDRDAVCRISEDVTEHRLQLLYLTNDNDYLTSCQHSMQVASA